MDLPDIGRYRRRFIVEFGPEDSGLIDRMGVAHRTKRAAIIAGLRLLDSGESEQLRARVSTPLTAGSPGDCPGGPRREGEGRPRCEAGCCSRPRPTCGRSVRNSPLPAPRSDSSRRRTRKSDGQIARTDCRAGPPAGRPPPPRLLRLLRAGSCRIRLGRAAATQGGVYVYHNPDGYRPKATFVGGPTTVLFWRATPR